MRARRTSTVGPLARNIVGRCALPVRSCQIIRRDRGGPGMREMLAITGAIKGAGLGRDILLMTDGRFSGGTTGPSVGHVAPKATDGPIAFVRDGDRIVLDIDKGASTWPSTSANGAGIPCRRATLAASSPSTPDWSGRPRPASSADNPPLLDSCGTLAAWSLTPSCPGWYVVLLGVLLLPAGHDARPFLHCSMDLQAK